MTYVLLTTNGEHPFKLLAPGVITWSTRGQYMEHRGHYMEHRGTSYVQGQHSIQEHCSLSAKVNESQLVRQHS